MKSHFIYIKRTVSGDFPVSDDDLLVLAALNLLYINWSALKIFKIL